MSGRKHARLPSLRIGPASLDIRSAKPAPKTADYLYTSREWHALRDEIIRERGPYCQDPRCANPDGPHPKLIGDHIVEIKDGGAEFDKANIMLRCSACHARKTAAARALRMKG